MLLIFWLFVARIASNMWNYRSVQESRDLPLALSFTAETRLKTQNFLFKISTKWAWDRKLLAFLVCCLCGRLFMSVYVDIQFVLARMLHIFFPLCSLALSGCQRASLCVTVSSLFWVKAGWRVKASLGWRSPDVYDAAARPGFVECSQTPPLCWVLQMLP